MEKRTWRRWCSSLSWFILGIRFSRWWTFISRRRWCVPPPLLSPSLLSLATLVLTQMILPQAAYIDKKDFLNTVVREKKKFESSLDTAVAEGLNAAVNILMTQVEHLVTTRQGARDYCPAEGDDDFDLEPTKACRDVVRVLKQHCGMIRGSADKQIIEVFTQEVGIRLHTCVFTSLLPSIHSTDPFSYIRSILLKHLKRMIVSTTGGLQLIADLNAYHAFVTTLRLSQITAYFTSLKMVGEIYLVEDPKDLGALVRDAGRYEGTLSPDDLYELGSSFFSLLPFFRS